jgi:AraC family ethanolamine operon transcriptional activator
VDVDTSTRAIATLQAQFESLSEYLSATAELGWEQEFRQLDRGPGPASVKAVIGSTSLLVSVEYGNLLHQRIMPPEKCLSFGILAGPQAPIKLGASEVQADSLMYFDRRDGLDAVSHAGFGGITLSFDRELFCLMADQQELPTPDDGLYFSTSARAQSVARIGEIRRLVLDIIAAADNPRATPWLEEAMAFTLPRLVHQYWHGGAEPRAARASGRARVLSKAMDYINCYSREAVKVEQLCQVSAGSMSTLERAFKEQFGVSPKRYVISSRLCGVRRALLDHSDDRSITDIAFDWGFWHMGKFASDYNTLFGQLPSQTRLGHRSCTIAVPR